MLLPHNVSMMWLFVAGFQLAWFKKSWVSIWLCLLVWTGKMHSEAWAASLSDDIRPGHIPVSPESYSARIKADSRSCLPAKAGPAGNQLLTSVQQGWS